jgi:uncharacterized protein YjgD (DUF1641 family)
MPSSAFFPDAVGTPSGAGETLLETVVEFVKTPEAIRTIRNLLLFSKVLGEIEPELLSAVARTLPDGLAQVSAKRSETPGLFSLLQRFGSKDSRRAMGAAAELLESVGRGLRSASAQKESERT